MKTEKQRDFIKHMQESVGVAYSIKAIFDNLDVDEIVEEVEKYKQQHIEDVCVGFYEWMQQYQDISAAIRILEVEGKSELFQEYIKQLNK